MNLALCLGSPPSFQIRVTCSLRGYFQIVGCFDAETPYRAVTVVRTGICFEASESLTSWSAEVKVDSFVFDSS